MNLRNVWRLLSRLARSLLVLDSEPARAQQPLVLFSCYDVDRSMREGGLAFSPILFGIQQCVEELGYACANLTHPYATAVAADVRGGAITVNYRAYGIRLAATAARVLGASFAQRVRLSQETRLYAGLLQRLKPEAVFAIQPPPALCRAARGIGVQVIEPMHGNNISLSDRFFCHHMSRADELLPHVILSFDDVSQNTMSSLCAGRGIVALRVADPWWLSCRRQASARPVAVPSGTKQVLVTLQWGYDGEREPLAGIIPDGVLHPALERAIALAADRGVRFLVRLHPIQMNAPGYRHHRRVVQSLAARHAHLEFERATSWPLPLLLDEISAHITMSSASAGQAAMAKVPSLMLCPTLHAGGAHHGLFRELEAAGLVTFGALDAGAIVDWIDQCPLRSPTPYPADEIECEHQAALSSYAAMIGKPACARNSPQPRALRAQYR